MHILANNITWQHDDIINNSCLLIFVLTKWQIMKSADVYRPILSANDTNKVVDQPELCI